MPTLGLMTDGCMMRQLSMLAESSSTLLVRSVGEHWKDGERYKHPIHTFFAISQLCHNHGAAWTASAWHEHSRQCT